MAKNYRGNTDRHNFNHCWVQICKLDLVSYLGSKTPVCDSPFSGWHIKITHLSFYCEKVVYPGRIWSPNDERRAFNEDWLIDKLMWNEHPFPFANLERTHSLIEFIHSILPRTGWGNFLGVVWIKVSGFILFPSLFLWQYYLYPPCTSKAFLLFKGYNKSWAKIDYLITEFLVEI